MSQQKRYAVVLEPIYWISTNDYYVPKEIVVFESDSRIITEREMNKTIPCVDTGHCFYKRILQKRKEF